MEHVRAIERGEDGILVGTFEPASREQILRATRKQWVASGIKVLSQRQVKVAGVDGVQLVGVKNDIRDRTTILYGSAFMAYWIKCLTPDDHRATWAACDQVLRTFRLRSRRA